MMKCKENFTLNEDVQLELKKRFIKYNHFNLLMKNAKLIGLLIIYFATCLDTSLNVISKLHW